MRNGISIKIKSFQEAVAKFFFVFREFCNLIKLSSFESTDSIRVLLQLINVIRIHTQITWEKYVHTTCINVCHPKHDLHKHFLEICKICKFKIEMILFSTSF